MGAAVQSRSTHAKAGSGTLAPDGEMLNRPSVPPMAGLETNSQTLPWQNSKETGDKGGGLLPDRLDLTTVEALRRDL